MIIAAQHLSDGLSVLPLSTEKGNVLFVFDILGLIITVLSVVFSSDNLVMSDICVNTHTHTHTHILTAA